MRTANVTQVSFGAKKTSRWAGMSQIFSFKAKSSQAKAQTVPMAALGIVDIIDSSLISNSISPEIDFAFKSEFHNAASIRAKEHKIVILNHTGDGFLFMANKNQSNEWQKNLIAFHAALVEDFNSLLQELTIHTGIEFQSGLRCGVAAGEVVLGHLTSNPSYFTAVGATVNLASRLCSAGSASKIVFSLTAWNLMTPQHSNLAAHFDRQSFKGFNGMTDTVQAGHLHSERALNGCGFVGMGLALVA